MSLRDYASVVWRRKLIVFAAAAMAVIGAIAMSSMQDPIYSAEAQMLVEPRAGEAVFQQDPTLGVQNLDRAIRTEIRVLEGQRVRDRVQENLGLDRAPPRVSADPVGSTDVVAVTVRSHDPETAQVMADAYVDAYISIRREQGVENLEAQATQLQATVDRLQRQVDDADGDSAGRQQLISRLASFQERIDQLEIDAALVTGGAQVNQSAEVPTNAVEPQPTRTAVLAGIVGLLIGLAAAFLIEYVDDSLREADQVEALSGLPVLAAVPVQAPPDHRPIALSRPHEFAVEMYRGLRTSLQFIGLDKPLRVIQVTSAVSGEGKTTTATNLAVVLAQAGNRVALLDADLRRPRAHEVFAVAPRPGLTERMIGEDSDEVAITDLEELHVIVAGTPVPNPSEMLASARFGQFVAELRREFDFVVIDSAPVLPVADSLALSRVVDGVLVVTQAKRTSKRTLSECLARLTQVGAPLVGVVLNRASGSDRVYGYGYGYGYGTVKDAGADATTGAAPKSSGSATATDRTDASVA